MATAEEYIAQAASYIGVSGTDNIFNTWIWGHPCYDPNIYPWCAAFQSYVGVHDLDMPFSPSASAAGVANQGERIDDDQVAPGDWVLFNWDGRQSFGWADDIGLVEWFDHSSGYFGTIEGNCDDMVKRCTRYNYSSYATAFFRPPFSSAPQPVDPDSWPIQTYDINLTNAQKWFPKKISENVYTLENVANGMVLDVEGAGTKSGTSVRVHKPNDSKAQQWKLRRQTVSPSGATYAPDFVAPFVLIPMCATKTRLDVAGNSKENGGTLQIYKANNSNGQNFNVLDNGDGTWTLIHVGSGKAVDVIGGGKR